MRNKGFIVFLILLSIVVFGGLYYIKTNPDIDEKEVYQMVDQTITDVVKGVKENISSSESESKPGANKVIDSLNKLDKEARKIKDNIISSEGEEVWDLITSPSTMCSSREEVINRLCNEFAAYKTMIELVIPSDMANGDYLNDVLSEVFSAHPQWFWFTGGGNWSLITIGDRVHATFTADTICDASEIPSLDANLKYEVANIANAARSFYSEYEMVKFVHDEIVLRCRYDQDVYESVFINGSDENSFSFTAYGCLINGVAVCDGYTKAFKIIMDELGIEAGSVVGYAYSTESSGPHSWNYCLIDGAYYFIDVTWDDPTGDLPEDYISYDYFCVTTDMILADHEFDGGQFIPECYDMTYVGLAS